jgi:protein associated with RNAse G/E
VQELPREIWVRATNYDGSPHWDHPAQLLKATPEIVITQTQAGLEVRRGDGTTYVSPFNTHGHYWPDRWFNAIRLEEPGKGLVGFYCNVASPVQFDGETVRYIDLQLDVRVFVEDGVWRHEVWDEDEFKVARQRYGYGEALVERCWAAVAELVRMIEVREFPFVDSETSSSLRQAQDRL